MLPQQTEQQSSGNLGVADGIAGTSQLAALPTPSSPAPAIHPRGRFDLAKRVVRAALPLGVRKALARFLGTQERLPGRHWWAHELLRDLAERDPNEYHRFLWAHHLGYAETYEVALRFGRDRIHPTRKLLFGDLVDCLGQSGVKPESIDSVFEVGCSLGYNLQYLETDVFPRASVLHGCDIDEYAIDRGSAHLGSTGSRVHVFRADMKSLGRRLAGSTYDITLCAGVLMYLEREDAEQVVADVLHHTNIVAAFAGLADPVQDNATLEDSRVRARDGTFIHDIDGMVTRAGGTVIRRRYEGPRMLDGNTVYFVFAIAGPA